MLMDKILEDRKSYQDHYFVFELSRMQEAMNFLHTHGVVDNDSLDIANEDGTSMKVKCNLIPANLAKYEKLFGAVDRSPILSLQGGVIHQLT